jgi:hypothetical protein
VQEDEKPCKYNAGHYYAAMYVKTAVKGFLARLQLEPLWEVGGSGAVVCRMP